MTCNLRLAFLSLWRRKFRSGLTILCIMAGIASIIVITTLSSDSKTVKPQSTASSDVSTAILSLYMDGNPIDMSDMSLPGELRVVTGSAHDEISEMRQIKAISFFTSRDIDEGVTNSGNSITGGSLFGVDSQYFNVLGYKIVGGRDFIEEDRKSSAKVAIIDRQAMESLFRGERPLGRIIDIMGEPFTIIGVAELGDQPEPDIITPDDYYDYLERNGGNVFITDAAWPLVYRFDEAQSLALRTKSFKSLIESAHKVCELLNAGLRQLGLDAVEYSSEVFPETKEKMETSSGYHLIWAGGLTLLVAGIAVMNTMLLSVTERMPEIGLQAALGATRRVIAYRFLTEATLLSIIGGLLGILSGILISTNSVGLFGMSAMPSALLLAFCVLISAIMGVVFGLYPALKAANLLPAYALRQKRG